MTLEHQGDHLVIKYRSGDTERHSRVLEAEPESVQRDRRIVTDGGAAYLTGWVPCAEGLGQFTRVAWPDRR